MIVTRTRQMIEKNRLSPIQFKSANTAGMPTFGNVQAAIVEDETIDWGTQIPCNQSTLAISINAPYATTRSHPTKGKSRLSHVDTTLLIKSEAGWE
jgi:hypothetical protein